MTNTPFSNRVQILADVSTFYGEEEDWQYFIRRYDLAIPLAVCISYGGATATPKGVEWINEAFVALCELFEIDPYGNYDSLEGMTDFATGE